MVTDLQDLESEARATVMILTTKCSGCKVQKVKIGTLHILSSPITFNKIVKKLSVVLVKSDRSKGPTTIVKGLPSTCPNLIRK